MKKLHNLYREGKLKIAKDDLVTIKHTDDTGVTTNPISVPTSLFPGLIHALHRKFNHPSKQQLTKLAARHFYSPGYHRVIEEVHNSCEMCMALKHLPKEIFSQSTGNVEGFGTNFSADVVERNNQQILVIREKMSLFTITRLIKNQSSDTLKEALIPAIIDYVPSTGAKVQVDCATGWAKLSSELQRKETPICTIA